MQAFDFNIEAARPLYSYQKSPVNPKGYLIFKANEDSSHDPQPVGDYTVLDAAEPEDLSERKVMNLISLLNGRKTLVQLGHETKSRVLYRILNKDSEDDSKYRVIFYHLGTKGISVENALFQIERSEHVH